MKTDGGCVETRANRGTSHPVGDMDLGEVATRRDEEKGEAVNEEHGECYTSMRKMT